MNPKSRRWAQLAVVAVAGLCVAACGSGPSTPTAGSTSSTTPSNSQLVAYAHCMRAHGIPDFPDPVDGHFPKQQLLQLGISATRMRSISADCDDLLPAGPPPLTAQQQQDYVRAANCMRSQGVVGFPDPTFADGSVNFPIPSTIDTNSPRFAQARQVCVKYIPAGLPYNDQSGG